jgi:hypothetical protein
MSAYRIKALGAHVIVGTEDEAVLICTTLDVARQAVADAECAPTVATWLLLSQRAARIGDKADQALAADISARIHEAVIGDDTDLN